MIDPVTKFTTQVVGPAYIPSRVREAFRQAAEGRPGATHFEIPEDILREEIDYDLGGFSTTVGSTGELPLASEALFSP